MTERFRAILDRITYKDWTFHLGEKGGVHFLQLHWTALCMVGGVPVCQHSRKWMLSEHMTDSEIVQTALLAVLTAEEHEAREQFLFDGAAVFGPHFSVRALAEVQERDVRAPALQN